MKPSDATTEVEQTMNAVIEKRLQDIRTDIERELETNQAIVEKKFYKLFYQIQDQQQDLQESFSQHIAKMQVPSGSVVQDNSIHRPKKCERFSVTEVNELDALKESVEYSSSILLDIQEQVNELNTRMTFVERSDLQYCATQKKINQDLQNLQARAVGSYAI